MQSHYRDEYIILPFRYLCLTVVIQTTLPLSFSLSELTHVFYSSFIAQCTKSTEPAIFELPLIELYILDIIDPHLEGH